MAEHNLTDCSGLWERARNKAQKTNNGWQGVILDAMNPRKMSQSDIDICETILDTP